MQVVRTAYTRHCPFILESDVLSLSSDFITRANASILYDQRLGASHTIHAPGNHLIAALAAGSQHGALQAVAQKHDVSDIQLCELLGFTNSIGALHFARRSTKQRVQAIRLQLTHLAMGVRYAVRVWRQPATALAITAAAARACMPIAVAALLVGAFFVSSGLFAPAETAGVILYGVSGFIVSITLHEAAHVRIIRRGSSSVVLQHGLRMGIVHRTLAPTVEILSACIGPAAGMLWCALMAIVTIAFGFAMLGVLAICMALFHTMSFLPWYGDGHSIREALRKQHTVTA